MPAAGLGACARGKLSKNQGMPEGPETRRAADRLARILTTGKPVEIDFPYPKISPWRDELAQTPICEVTSRGKALLIRFENGLTFRLAR